MNDRKVYVGTGRDPTSDEGYWTVTCHASTKETARRKIERYLVKNRYNELAVTNFFVSRVTPSPSGILTVTGLNGAKE